MLFLEMVYFSCCSVSCYNYPEVQPPMVLCNSSFVIKVYSFLLFGDKIMVLLMKGMLEAFLLTNWNVDLAKRSCNQI